MFVLAAVPICWPRARQYNSSLLLFGTGSLVGICAFDLLPDFYKMGGLKGLPLMVAAALVFSIAHLFQGHDHAHSHEHDFADEHTHSHALRSPYIFLVAITVHCFTSGLLLGVSDQFSKHLADSVFAALFIHKIYESFAVSVLLVSYKRRTLWTVSMLSLYLLSFPAGAAVAKYYGQVNHELLLIITGIAIGSLIGCLIFDFIVPSFQQIRQNRRQLIWLIAGLLVTAVLI